MEFLQSAVNGDNDAINSLRDAVAHNLTNYRWLFDILNALRSSPPTPRFVAEVLRPVIDALSSHAFTETISCSTSTGTAVGTEAASLAERIDKVEKINTLCQTFKRDYYCVLMAKIKGNLSKVAMVASPPPIVLLYFSCVYRMHIADPLEIIELLPSAIPIQRSAVYRWLVTIAADCPAPPPCTKKDATSLAICAEWLECHMDTSTDAVASKFVQNIVESGLYADARRMMDLFESSPYASDSEWMFYGKKMKPLLIFILRRTPTPATVLSLLHQVQEEWAHQQVVGVNTIDILSRVITRASVSGNVPPDLCKACYNAAIACSRLFAAQSQAHVHGKKIAPGCGCLLLSLVMASNNTAQIPMECLRAAFRSTMNEWCRLLRPNDHYVDLMTIGSSDEGSLIDTAYYFNAWMIRTPQVCKDWMFFLYTTVCESEWWFWIAWSWLGNQWKYVIPHALPLRTHTLAYSFFLVFAASVVEIGGLRLRNGTMLIPFVLRQHALPAIISSPLETHTRLAIDYVIACVKKVPEVVTNPLLCDILHMTLRTAVRLPIYSIDFYSLCCAMRLPMLPEGAGKIVQEIVKNLASSPDQCSEHHYLYEAAGLLMKRYLASTVHVTLNQMQYVMVRPQMHVIRKWLFNAYRGIPIEPKPRLVKWKASDIYNPFICPVGPAPEPKIPTLLDDDWVDDGIDMDFTDAEERLDVDKSSGSDRREPSHPMAWKTWTQKKQNLEHGGEVQQKGGDFLETVPPAGSKMAYIIQLLTITSQVSLVDTPLPLVSGNTVYADLLVKHMYVHISIMNSHHWVHTALLSTAICDNVTTLRDDVYSSTSVYKAAFFHKLGTESADFQNFVSVMRESNLDILYRWYCLRSNGGIHESTELLHQLANLMHEQLSIVPTMHLGPPYNIPKEMLAPDKGKQDLLEVSRDAECNKILREFLLSPAMIPEKYRNSFDVSFMSNHDIMKKIVGLSVMEQNRDLQSYLQSMFLCDGDLSRDFQAKIQSEENVLLQVRMAKEEDFYNSVIGDSRYRGAVETFEKARRHPYILGFLKMFDQEKFSKETLTEQIFYSPVSAPADDGFAGAWQSRNILRAVRILTRMNLSMDPRRKDCSPAMLEKLKVGEEIGAELLRGLDRKGPRTILILRILNDLVRVPTLFDERRFMGLLHSLGPVPLAVTSSNSLDEEMRDLICHFLAVRYLNDKEREGFILERCGIVESVIGIAKRRSIRAWQIPAFRMLLQACGVDQSILSGDAVILPDVVIPVRALTDSVYLLNEACMCYNDEKDWMAYFTEMDEARQDTAFVLNDMANFFRVHQ